MRPKMIRIENFVSEFIPEENEEEIPEELKNSSLFLNMKGLKDNEKENNGMNNQQMLNPPIVVHKPIESHTLQKENQSKKESIVEIQNPKKNNKFRSQLEEFKKKLKNMYEEHEEMENKLSKFRSNISALGTSKEKRGQSLSREKKLENKISPLSNQCPHFEKTSSEKEAKSKKAHKLEGPKICSIKSLEKEVSSNNVLNGENFRGEHKQKKENEINFPLKEKKKAPEEKEKASVRYLKCSKDSMENIFEHIELPPPSNHQQPIPNTLSKSDKYCNLFKEMKSYVQKPQSMKVFEIDLVAFSFAGGLINKTDREYCEYKDILGIIILGGNPHIWIEKHNLMKLQFTYDHLTCLFYEHMNRTWN